MKSFLLALFASLFACALQAAPLDSLFVKAPREVLPLLGLTERLDLLDLYAHGMEAKAENTLGGQSQLLEKTENRLKMKTSEAGTWEMRLYCLEGDSLILVIRSVKAVGVQSEVSAYRTDWSPAFLPLPSPSLGRLIDMASSSISPLRKQELLSILREQPVRVEFTGEKRDLLTFSIDLSGVSLNDREDAAGVTRSATYELLPNGGFVRKE
ncbi:MAG: DUF3256 family protein [Alloprevotella sp.]